MNNKSAAGWPVEILHRYFNIKGADYTGCPMRIYQLAVEGDSPPGQNFYRKVKLRFFGDID